MNTAALEIEKTDTVIDPSLRNQYVERISALWHRSREAVIALGRMLTAAKRALPHGEFLAMIEADLPFSRNTASKFMRIANDPKISNVTTSLHLADSALPSSPDALDAIRKLPDKVFVSLLKEGIIGPDTTIAEAQSLARQVGPHRPMAHTMRAPIAPTTGYATNYAELVWLLRELRVLRGLTGFDLDEIVGWTDRYVEKLENPHRPHGRLACNPSFSEWLQGLGIGLLLVDAKTGVPITTR